MWCRLRLHASCRDLLAVCVARDSRGLFLLQLGEPITIRAVGLVANHRCRKTSRSDSAFLSSQLARDGSMDRGGRSFVSGGRSLTFRSSNPAVLERPLLADRRRPGDASERPVSDARLPATIAVRFCLYRRRPMALRKQAHPTRDAVVSPAGTDVWSTAVAAFSCAIRLQPISLLIRLNYSI